MTITHRISVLPISLLAVAILSACQPKPKEAESTLETQITPVAIEEPVIPAAVEVYETVDIHADHKMITDENLINDTPMTESIKRYAKAIGRMHSEMMVGMAYNDPDSAFAKAMLANYRGTTEMAELELKYGSDEQIQQFAQQAIDDQQPEIDLINKWLASHPDAAKPKPTTQAMQQAYSDVVEPMYDEMMRNLTEAKLDVTFVRSMLAQYQGAVAIAKIQLQYGKDLEMRQLAQQIISDQYAQIESLQNLIAANETSNQLLENGSESNAADDLVTGAVIQ